MCRRRAASWRKAWGLECWDMLDSQGKLPTHTPTLVWVAKVVTQVAHEVTTVTPVVTAPT